MRRFIKRLFCKHDYIKVDWHEKEDRYRNIRYSMRKYKCKKCGKEIWLDGRYSTLNI